MRAPLLVLTDTISFFLAGSFTMRTGICLQDDGTLQIINLFIVIIGSILILAAFLVSLTALQFERFRGYVEKLNQWLFWLYPILFAVIASEVVALIINFRGITPLFITAIVFLIFVLVVIGLTSRRVFQNVRSLLSMSVTFNVIAVILLFMESEKIQVITVLIISTTLLLWTVLRVLRQIERQQNRL